MIELTKQTVMAWRSFLKTDAGKDGLLFLREKEPAIPAGQPHEIQYYAGFNQGYIKAIDMLSYLAGKENDKQENLENP